LAPEFAEVFDHQYPGVFAVFLMRYREKQGHTIETPSPFRHGIPPFGDFVGRRDSGPMRIRIKIAFVGDFEGISDESFLRSIGKRGHE
jgi:hypothetical protein